MLQLYLFLFGLFDISQSLVIARTFFFKRSKLFSFKKIFTMLRKNNIEQAHGLYLYRFKAQLPF